MDVSKNVTHYVQTLGRVFVLHLYVIIVSIFNFMAIYLHQNNLNTIYFPLSILLLYHGYQGRVQRLGSL